MMKAILTGHTRGLGAAVAEELLARGIPVLALAQTRQAALAERFPALLEQVELDLADSAALSRWLAGGPLERFLAGCETALLVNNAGVLQPMGPAGAQDAPAIARAISLNVTAPLMLTNALVAATPEAAGRRILHVSSGAARSPYPGWSIYCATKAALDHHARTVALDRVPGLRISSLAPGVIDTDMQAEIRASSAERFPLRERFVALKRQGQLSSPGDAAARLVAYLLGENFGQEPVTDLRELP
jgi:benzil reductase ((S)-benzoin forming)